MLTIVQHINCNIMDTVYNYISFLCNCGGHVNIIIKDNDLDVIAARIRTHHSEITLMSIPSQFGT